MSLKEVVQHIEMIEKEKPRAQLYKRSSGRMKLNNLCWVQTSDFIQYGQEVQLIQKDVQERQGKKVGLSILEFSDKTNFTQHTLLVVVIF